MEQLFINFREKVKQHHNLVESICLSNSNGVIWCEQYIPSNRRNIYSHSKSFTSLMVGICINNSRSLEFEYGIGSIKEYSNEIPLDFKEINIPATLWGKFYTKGKMPDAIQKLWKEVMDWVENSEYEVALNYDFECCTEGDTSSEDYVSGIWIALKLK